MKQQIVMIHGGTTWPIYEDYLNYLTEYPLERIEQKAKFPEKKIWSGNMRGELGQDFELIAPSMPSSQNAKYAEWVLWFEKHLPLFEGDVILIGHSLGGVFLAKYLSQRDLPVRVKQLHLVAAPIEDTPDESLCDFNFDDVENLRAVNAKVDEIFIYHSEDDPVVPFKDGVAYAHYLQDAEFVRFLGRGHFLGEEFPELVERVRGA